jgi:isocitrate dehydrogenase
LATQDKNPDLKAKFTTLAQQLKENEGAIVAELAAAQGRLVAIGGYYHPDMEKVSRAMRPSGILNGAIEAMH